MEFVSKINIFGLIMMMKSGLEKILLKSLHAQSHFLKIFFTSWRGDFLQKKYKFSNKKDPPCAWRDYKKSIHGVCKYI